VLDLNAHKDLVRIYFFCVNVGTAAVLCAVRRRTSDRAVGALIQRNALMAILIAITHVLVRDLSSDVHPIQIAFFRNVIGFLMLVPFLLRQDRVHWKSKQPKLQFIRAMIGTCAMLSWFTCLSMLPVADATAISFVTVLFITIGASVFLGEKVGVRRWVAIAVG
ncbi:MAG: DMT family transporter, partial [Rhodospirillales bacterium]